jgi:hypothetical protein
VTIALEDIVLMLGVALVLAGLWLLLWPTAIVAAGAGLILTAVKLAERRRMKGIST